MNDNRQPEKRQRPPMTPEQRKAYEERKRAYFEKKRREEEEHKRLVRRRLVLGMIFALTLAVIFAAAAIIVSVSLSKGDPKAPKTYTFNIDGTTERVAYKDANRGGLIYIDVRALMDILGLTESSSRTDSVTFTASRSTKNYVVFTNGSIIAAVNGMNVTMPGAADVSPDACFVPLETVSYIFAGITVKVNGSRIGITPDGDTVDILAKSTDPLDMIISFKNNLDEYEGYMNPQGENRDKYLLLVNKQHPLGENFVPSDLVTLTETYCANTNANQINACAAKALEAMLKELWSSGLAGADNITGTSGYRSYSRQLSLYNGYINDEMAKNGISREAAEKIVVSYCAVAGTSEHQSGLCIDLVDMTRGEVENYSDTGCFTTTAIYNWLVNNAWKFGFILRYPSDKVSITGYEYESWHFRFVGRYHAQKIYSDGLTLEEYLASMNR